MPVPNSAIPFSRDNRSVFIFIMTTNYPLQLYVIRDSHCIHVDQKASETTKKAIAAIIECYKNKYPNTSIFIAADPVPVYWGYFSVLEVR